MSTCIATTEIEKVDPETDATAVRIGTALDLAEDYWIDSIGLPAIEDLQEWGRVADASLLDAGWLRISPWMSDGPDLSCLVKRV